MVSFNINDFIKVKLTDLGKEIYDHHNDDLIDKCKNLNLKPLPLDIDDEGYCKFQLWKFMQIFGKHFGAGFPNVIEPNRIFLNEKDLIKEE